MRHLYKMSDTKLIRCIYCGMDGVPASREHVLQSNLGGDLTAKVVCEACNTGFSPIDQSLGENSLLALHRVGFTKPGDMPVRLGGEHFTHIKDANLWAEVKISNGMQANLYPQIHLLNGNLAVLGTDPADISALTKLIESKIADGSFGSTYIKIDSSEHASTVRIVGHRKKDMFVRAASEVSGKSFLDLLSSNFTALKAQMKANAPKETPEEIPTPSVTVTQRVCLDDNFRAAAKIAFNFVAVRKGVDFALREEFIPIRRYIQGIDLEHDPDRAPGQIAVDQRFVSMAPVGQQPLLPTDSHAVCLFYREPTLLGLITLYGKFSFIVKLSDIQLTEQVLEAHEFTTNRKGNMSLDAGELARRISILRKGELD